MAASSELQYAREARERAQTARAQALEAGDRAWQQRCDALAMIMRARELGPPLRLRIAPDSAELRGVREKVRLYAGARVADVEAVVLAAHEAVAHILTTGEPITAPIDLQLGVHQGRLELRVHGRAPTPAEDAHTDDGPTSLRLIAALADQLEIRSHNGNAIEILASFATSQP